MFGNKRYRAPGAAAAAAAETITIEVTPPEDGEDLSVISNKTSPATPKSPILMQEQDNKVRDRLGDEIDHETQLLQKEEESTGEAEAAIKLHMRSDSGNDAYSAATKRAEASRSGGGGPGGGGGGLRPGYGHGRGPHGGSAVSLSSLRRYVSKTSIASAVAAIRTPPGGGGGGGNLQKQSQQQSDRRRLWLVVAAFFLVVVALVVAAHVAYYRHIGELRLFGHLKLEEADRNLLIYDRNDNLILSSHIGVNLPHHSHPYPCIDRNNLHQAHHTETVSDEESEDGQIEIQCLEWKNKARLNISHQFLEGNANCYSLAWQSLSPDVSPMDCYPVGDDFRQGHWYGGGETTSGRWPLDKGQIQLSAFITGDEGRNQWGSVIKKYFLNSRGLSLTVADHTPLFVSFNDDEHPGLCLQARYDDFAYFYHRYELPLLNYTICTDSDNLWQLNTKFMPKTSSSIQKNVPQQSNADLMHPLMEKPIWQVHVPSNGRISHSHIEKYIERVVGKANDKEGRRGYLMLDYHWQRNMGDLHFNREEFPDINATMEMIRNSGLELVLTVNPFVSTSSRHFQTADHEGYFVIERNSTSGIPALTRFKDAATVGLLDLTKEDALEWFNGRLTSLIETLQQTSPGSGSARDFHFYLDKGNSFHTPTYFEFSVPYDNPDLYGDFLLEAVMESFPVIGVSGASSKRPAPPAFVFMTPLSSDWSSLRSVVPNILQLGIIGYPFVNPGPVGGIGSANVSVSSNNERTLREDMELYIRWWQLNTFLPVLHYYKPPTAFPKKDIAKTAQKLLRIRKDVVEPALIELSSMASDDAVPLIRPLWSIAPNDEVALAIDDQFLVGDRLLVAPVLHAGRVERDVYLPDPSSSWRRGGDHTGDAVKGGHWLNATSADQEEVVYFVREENVKLT